MFSCVKICMSYWNNKYFQYTTKNIFHWTYYDNKIFVLFFSDFKYTQWPEETDSEGKKIRTINYGITVTYSLGTKLSNTQEKQILYSQSRPGHIYVVDTECASAGIPYTDTFIVANRYCLTRISANKCRLRITSEIQYKKHVWGVIKSKYMIMMYILSCIFNNIWNIILEIRKSVKFPCQKYTTGFIWYSFWGDNFGGIP